MNQWELLPEISAVLTRSAAEAIKWQHYNIKDTIYIYLLLLIVNYYWKVFKGFNNLLNKPILLISAHICAAINVMVVHSIKSKWNRQTKQQLRHISWLKTLNPDWLHLCIWAIDLLLLFFSLKLTKRVLFSHKNKLLRKHQHFQQFETHSKKSSCCSTGYTQGEMHRFTLRSC